jgi:hypothetical protein
MAAQAKIANRRQISEYLLINTAHHWIIKRLNRLLVVKRETMSGVKRRQHKGLNNRAENRTSRPDDENGR